MLIHIHMYTPIHAYHHVWVHTHTDLQYPKPILAILVNDSANC